MSTITINDLEVARDLDKQALETIGGGNYWNGVFGYTPYRQPFNPYGFIYQPAYINPRFHNPFVASVQSATASRAAMFESSNSAWMSNFTSSW